MRQPLRPLRPEASWSRSHLLDDANQAARLERAMTDQDIANLLDADIKAKFPTGVAIAKVQSGYQPSLETISAEELEGWSKAVQRQKMILSVHPVTSLAIGDRPIFTLRDIRTAAARMGCELLLVYLQADSSVKNLNDAAALYWTFAGLGWCPAASTSIRR